MIGGDDDGADFRRQNQRFCHIAARNSRPRGQPEQRTGGGRAFDSFGNREFLACTLQPHRPAGDRTERGFHRLNIGFRAVRFQKNPLQDGKLAIRRVNPSEQREAPAAARMRRVATPAKRRRVHDALDAPALQVKEGRAIGLDRLAAVPKRAGAREPGGWVRGGARQALGPRGRQRAAGGRAQQGAEGGAIVAVCAPNQRPALAHVCKRGKSVGTQVPHALNANDRMDDGNENLGAGAGQAGRSRALA